MTTSEKTLHILIPIVICIVMFIVLSILQNRHNGRKWSLHRKYFLHLIQLIIIMLCIANVSSVFFPTFEIDKLLIRGSALIVAIVGFAAQPAISDLVCGLLISIHKPFEIGDRIVLDGQSPGIVEDINLRHTVIRIYDDLRIIVPNSELNSKIITNTSYKMSDRRGIHLQYCVSYDTDVTRAMDMIRDCVAESPYTLPVERNGIEEDSGPVYFLQYAESALLLDTTIWVSKNTNTYTAITDINLRVNNSFQLHGIEIPYNYLNVIKYKGKRDELASEGLGIKKTAPSKRHYRTNTIRLAKNATENAVRVGRRFAARQRLPEHEALQLELLCEESCGIVNHLMEGIRPEFWIEGSGLLYRIHLRFDAHVGSEEYKKLLSLSSSGRNEAMQGFAGKIREVLRKGLYAISDAKNGSEKDYEWNLSDDDINENEIGESILTSVASDIMVSIDSERVEITVIKDDMI